MRQFLLLALSLFVVTVLSRCAKGESDNPAPPPTNRTDGVPAITSITPTQGAALIQDTIYGQNFSTTASSNSVSFNGTPAGVLSATATRLIVTVPQNGTTGPVRVTVGGQTATGPVFTYKASDDSVMVITYAGTGTFGRTDGTLTTATFGFIWDMAFDQAGNLWVADGGYNRVRKIANGAVSSLIGLNTTPFMSLNQSEIQGLAVGANNLIYMTDTKSAPIRTIDAAGTVNNFVGSGFGGSADGTGTNAFFRSARNMIFDKAGNLIVADAGNNKIRKVTPSGVVTTLAGNMGGVSGFLDGTGTATYFFSPQSLTLDKDDNLYVADKGNHRIRKITPAGVVTTIAGNGQGNYADGYGLSAGIMSPTGIVYDNRTGNIYVTENGGFRIRKIRPDGYVSTIAGTGDEGSTDGPGRLAKFKNPMALVLDNDGNLLVADGGNYKIRKITFK